MFARHSNLNAFLRGAALGAAAMYLFDPDKGRRRRAIARDRMASFLTDAGDTLCDAGRDLANRAHGAQARARRWMHRDETTDDLQLIERVRARLGRVVSHPHAIQVGVRDALVTLSGPILAHEVEPLIATVRSVPGVRSVEEHLVVHVNADSVPGLQGQGRRRGRSDASNAPAIRAAALLSGGFLVLYGVMQRSASGLAVASLGAGLAARGARRPPRIASASRDDAVAPRQSRAEQATEAPGAGTV